MARTTLSISLLLLLLTILHIAPSSTLEQHQQQEEKKMSGVDVAALSELKKRLRDMEGTNFLSTWDFTSPDPCSTFAGITCSFNRRVTTLTLGTGLSDSPGLAGSLSPSISNLTELTQLVLFPGMVTGPIPPQLGQLSNLRVISLTNNRLTGPIPTSLSSLQYLHTLDLSYNQLSASIPPALTGLPNLKVLILASNGLSGEFPRVVSAQLLHLDVKSNRVRGLLPTSLPSSLRYLSVSNNLMWGPLNGLESLPNLVYLDLSMNQFNGPIPPSLLFSSSSSSSSMLFLQRNNLSGGLPSRIVSPTDFLNFGEGSILDLSHNFLTGELSPVLAGVETLFLNNNRFVGTVPKEYVKSLYLGTTKTLYLQHNYLTGFPLDPASPFPDSVSLCLSYNCMIPPVGLTSCPASAGGQLSRPMSQCSVFNNANSIH